MSCSYQSLTFSNFVLSDSEEWLSWWEGHIEYWYRRFDMTPYSFSSRVVFECRYAETVKKILSKFGEYEKFKIDCNSSLRREIGLRCFEWPKWKSLDYKILDRSWWWPSIHYFWYSLVEIWSFMNVNVITSRGDKCRFEFDLTIVLYLHVYNIILIIHIIIMQSSILRAFGL